MKLIAIGIETPDQSEFIFETLRDAHEKQRVVLEDAAYATDDGVVHVKGRTKRLFGEKIDDDQVKAKRPWVFALGEPEQMDAISRRVRTVSNGDIRTYDVAGDTFTETTGSDATYELSGDEAALAADADALPLEGFHQRRMA
jgi:hypothetical protein